MSETQKLHELFKQIWDERADEYGSCYCFETGQPMDKRNRNNTSCFHHVLKKGNSSRFSQYKFTKKNIVIILPEVHHNAETNLDKVPKIKAYKEELLELHRKREL